MLSVRTMLNIKPYHKYTLFLKRSQWSSDIDTELLVSDGARRGTDPTCFEVIGEGEGGILQRPTVSGKRHGGG